MIIAHTRELATERVQLTQLKPTRSVPALIDDARRGLLQSPRALPPRYFFDSHGVHLLEHLRRSPEFYPARREAELLDRHALDIVSVLRPTQIVEFAAGIAGSSRALLDVCQSQSHEVCYWPVEHNREALRNTVKSLAEAYPSLPIHAIEGECLGGLRHLPVADGVRLYLLLNSGIGRFTPSQTQRFLVDVRTRMGQGDALLLGVDCTNVSDTLNAAYNDTGGMAAAFNRHLLRILNQELSADFDPRAYAHVAKYNSALQQMELYLTADRDQEVQINALQQMIHIGKGESIRTGVCRKFTVKGLQSIMTAAGYTIEQHYQSEQGDYSLVLAVPRHARLSR